MRTKALTVAAMGALMLGGLAAIAQPQGPKGADRPSDRPQAEGKAVGQGFPDLVKGLKETPGCLGVETARTSSGKNLIFAWFKDKRAALAWYYSDMHKQAMRQFFPGPHRKPMTEVPDDGRPIMVIASLTMAEKSSFGEAMKLPFSQIAIELYRPLPGGAALGGRFAPKSLEVPNLLQYDPGEAGRPRP